jgi:hypothetical protein
MSSVLTSNDAGDNLFDVKRLEVERQRMMELMSLMALDLGVDRRNEVAKATMHAARGHPAHISEPIEAAVEVVAAQESRRGTGECWHGSVRNTGWQGNAS